MILLVASLTQEDETVRTKIRTLRHWKQRFNKNSKFVWRRAKVFAGIQYAIGDDLPEDVAMTKLRRFWESGVIELAEFQAPNVATGLVDEDLEPVDDEDPDESEGDESEDDEPEDVPVETKSRKKRKGKSQPDPVESDAIAET